MVPALFDRTDPGCQDPELFDGPKDLLQCETYRRMRKAVKGDWRAACPKTNGLWLHYLADVVAVQKPIPGLAAADCKELKAFRRRALGYRSAMEALHDPLFRGCWREEAAAGTGA